MTGSLSLSSPWCRAAIPFPERSAIESRIRDGYAIGVASNAQHTGYEAWVLELGETFTGNTLLHRDRRHYSDVHDAIDRAIAWLDEHLQEAA